MKGTDLNYLREFLRFWPKQQSAKINTSKGGSREAEAGRDNDKLLGIRN